MAELKPAYLIHGDDQSKLAEWRTRVRRRAEADRGPGGLEEFEPGPDSPEDVAAALSTLTFDTGTRYLLVDDASAWKAPALEPLAAALAAMPPDTVARADRPRQAAQGTRQGRRGGGRRGAESTRPPSRGSCRGGRSAARASWGCS